MRLLQGESHPEYDLFCSDDIATDFLNVGPEERDFFAEGHTIEDLMRIEFDTKVSRVEFDFFKKDTGDEHSSYREIISLASQKSGLGRIAVLNAHGNSINDSWVYFDKGKTHRVQSWINRNDGKYGVLILAVCNPEAQEVKCRKSVVLAPNAIYSGRLISQSEVQAEIVLPHFGYVESHLEDYILARLKKQCGQQKLYK